jgi:hypothetical protein
MHICIATLLFTPRRTVNYFIAESKCRYINVTLTVWNLVKNVRRVGFFSLRQPRYLRSPRGDVAGDRCNTVVTWNRFQVLVRLLS